MKFSELQQQLQENFGIDHLADIARELGVSPQSVSNWKSRDRVPYKYVVKIRKQLEESNTQVSEQSENSVTDSNKDFPQYSYPQYFEEETISFADILLVLARQFKIIIITPTIFCTGTILYVLFIAQPVYESTAKIMSSSGGSRVSQAAGLAAQFGINLPTGQSEPEWVYLEIIKSRILARTMLKQKFDTNEYGKEKSLLQILTYGNKKPEFGPDTLEVMAVKTFLEMIEVSEDLKTRVYTVTLSASEPAFAAELNSTLLTELDAHQREYNKAKTSETRKFIEERITDTRTELEAAEETLKDFIDRNRRIENSPALLLEEQRLDREVVVLTGVFTTLKQQLETTKIQEVKESDYVIVLDPPEVPLYPSKPRKRRSVIIGGFLGICLGMVCASIKDYFENSNSETQDKMWEIKSLIFKNIREVFTLKKRS